MSCSLMMAGCVGRETQCDGRGDTVGDTVGDIAWWGGGHSMVEGEHSGGQMVLRREDIGFCKVGKGEIKTAQLA